MMFCSTGRFSLLTPYWSEFPDLHKYYAVLFMHFQESLGLSFAQPSVSHTRLWRRSAFQPSLNIILPRNAPTFLNNLHRVRIRCLTNGCLRQSIRYRRHTSLRSGLFYVFERQPASARQNYNSCGVGSKRCIPVYSGNISTVVVAVILFIYP
jgi:hypothetical protein